MERIIFIFKSMHLFQHAGLIKKNYTIFTVGAIKKWTTQRNWQHMVHITKKKKTKTQHNMCWTPLYANKHI